MCRYLHIYSRVWNLLGGSLGRSNGILGTWDGDTGTVETVTPQWTHNMRASPSLAWPLLLVLAATAAAQDGDCDDFECPVKGKQH